MKVTGCASLHTRGRLLVAAALFLLCCGVLWITAPRSPWRSPWQSTSVDAHWSESEPEIHYNEIQLRYKYPTNALHIPYNTLQKANKHPANALPIPYKYPTAKHSSSPPSVAPSSGRPPLLILHWTEPPRDGFYYQVNTNASFAACPVSSCTATSDRSLFSQADVVLFHGHIMKMDDLPSLPRLPQQRFVFILRESPQRTNLPLEELDGFFNLTMTYSQQADVVFPYGETVAGRQKGTLPDFRDRLQPVAWMVSHCATTSRREEYVSQLRLHIPVDTLGDCGDRRCAGNRPDCYRRLAESHLFYLAFENSLCDDYITEKFWLPLLAGMVPVVRGPSPEAYRRVAPPNSFVHVEDFEGPQALAEYLLGLVQNRTEYGRYHAWRRTHHVELVGKGLCELCSGLVRDDREQVVTLSKVWSAETHCREPRDIVAVPVAAQSSSNLLQCPYMVIICLCMVIGIEQPP